ncbi:MAG TPA: hypothetical protein VGQ19_19540 [Burkholderiales bacterium]|nr:hypothetical protein [Burkholderiales bacterium]
MNLYVEAAQSRGANNAACLLPTPGFTAWSTVSNVVSRGSIVANGRLFFVFGGGFYEFSSTAVSTKWGTVVQDANPAQLAYNGKVGGQVGIASGGNVYSFTLATNTFAGPHFGGATTTMLAFADGYGLAFDATTGKVYLSALNDFTTWSLGTFFQRSKFPDPWQTMFVDPNGLIWMIGSETFEVWYDTGTGTQPWAPLSGLYGRHGIGASFAFGSSAQGSFWLARNAEGGTYIVTTRGADPQSIGTYAVDAAIAGYVRSSRVTDAELLLYHDQGHTFANFAFPSAMRTWTFDAEQKMWAERGLFNSAIGDYGLWAPRVHADCFGKHFVGDRTTGTVWVMDTAVSTDVDGQGIRRLRRSPALTNEGAREPIDKIRLLMDVGLGTATGQGSDPQALMRMSTDFGRTWGNEHRASIGRIGEYFRRVEWNRLGAPDSATVEIVWSDPSPVRVTDAWVNPKERAA